MTIGASNIDRKLCLTAALIGAVTRKDLANAFRKVNPRTTFDVERANKWIQGRSRPREANLYEDWALVLEIDRPGAWIADCALEDFIDLLCARRAGDRDALLRRAQTFAGDAGRAAQEARADFADAALLGNFVCYSHAWSPYFKGRLVRGLLSIVRDMAHRTALGAIYTEALPNGVLRATGPARSLRNGLQMDLTGDAAQAAFLFTRFPPTAPVSVLSGFMCGTTVLTSEPQPSMTRIVMVRLPGGLPDQDGAYLPPDASLARDLADFDVVVSDPAAADQLLMACLTTESPGRGDRSAILAHRSLVEFFDQEWARRACPVV